MLYLIQTFSDVAQQTFKTCFSPKSYLRGNTLTNELILHLIPFDHIDQINDYNQCKTALDKMNVQAYLHFDDVSFPKPADPKIYFKYLFNKQIEVVFPLSDSDYNSILDKPTAVFELRYDISYVIVNGSVSIVEHTKYNGTGCFENIAMKYEIYGDIEILTNPNNCQVDFAAGVQISFIYTSGSQNKEIPIYSCTSGCINGEFNSTSLVFQDVKLYRVKKTPALAQKLADFYAAFVKNRLIKMSFNIKFNTNGVDTTITQFIDNKTAVDSWGCVANDPQTATYFGLTLFTQSNPDGLFVQIRDSLKNALLCDTSPASKVNVDAYMMQRTAVYRQLKTIPMATFNETVGVQYDDNAEYQNFRDKIFVTDQTQSLIIVSFVDANGIILYEICTYTPAFMGCVAKQDIQIFDTQLCTTFKFETRADCKARYLPPNRINHVSVYYTENEKFNLLGSYNFPQAINYSVENLKICFGCDKFDPVFTNAAGSSCKDNWALTRKKLKLTGASVGLFYINDLENYNSHNIIAEYNTTWLPFIITTILLVIIIFFMVMYLIMNQK
ncbi:Conserved_hypothetical protein [Hexamita inflata]|uniref:Transmembrane protein n=1 Tax=Hexamita inflata TaxID=28002 RepID=A0AA86R3M8_9EUKA|nr:Conserved hypothetical protein [Hexamita inflata]